MANKQGGRLLLNNSPLSSCTALEHATETLSRRPVSKNDSDDEGSEVCVAVTINHRRNDSLPHSEDQGQVSAENRWPVCRTRILILGRFCDFGSGRSISQGRKRFFLNQRPLRYSWASGTVWCWKMVYCTVKLKVWTVSHVAVDCAGGQKKGVY